MEDMQQFRHKKYGLCEVINLDLREMVDMDNKNSEDKEKWSLVHLTFSCLCV